MARLFRRYIPMLYAIAAYFACFIAVQSESVTFILGGEKFNQAALAVTIMAFYPIHQTYGQLSGSVFYATGNTKLYRNIGITTMMLGLPFTYFLLAPSGKMGLDAGATGLALKMVIQQFLGVNVQLFFNARFLSLKFTNYLIHQVVSVGIMIILAFGADYLINHVFLISGNIIINFILSGMLYTFLVGAFSCVLPELLGLHKSDIRKIMSYVLPFLRRNRQ